MCGRNDKNIILYTAPFLIMKMCFFCELSLELFTTVHSHERNKWTHGYVEVALLTDGNRFVFHNKRINFFDWKHIATRLQWCFYKLTLPQ